MLARFSEFTISSRANETMFMQLEIMGARYLRVIGVRLVFSIAKLSTSDLLYLMACLNSTAPLNIDLKYAFEVY